MSDCGECFFSVSQSVALFEVVDSSLRGMLANEILRHEDA